MAEKLKTGEKSEHAKSEPNHPAKRRRLAEDTREKVKGLAQLRKFETSEIGREILAGFGSISEILESEDSLNPALGMLAIAVDDANREAILVFLKAASKKFPEMMRECVRDPDFDNQLRDRLIEEMNWVADELPIKNLERAKSQPSAEKPKSKKGPNTGAESPESLANELEKTEVFREVSELLECDGMMEDLRKRYKAIDWDQVMVNMSDYSVKGIEAYVKKNKLTLNRPLRIESVDGVISDPKMFEIAVRRLEWDHENVDPRHFGAFILMATEKNPESVFNYFSSLRYAELRDAHFKKAVVELLLKKGYKAMNAMFEVPPVVDEGYRSLLPVLPKEVISKTRKSLIEKGLGKKLPQEVLNIMGKSKTWSSAMDKEEVLKRFLEGADGLEKILDPELFEEMMLVAAEQYNEIDEFFKTYDATSWRQAMGSPVIFNWFMAGGWFGQVCPIMEPRLMLELLMVAVKESEENAKWILDKAKRDEKGDIKEEPAYELKKAIGKKSFQTLIEAAKQKAGVK